MKVSDRGAIVIAKESSLPRGLPKKTQSLCPECKKILDATIMEKGGKVVMEKECPEHGHFSDIVWSDVELYLKSEQFALTASAWRTRS